MNQDYKNLFYFTNGSIGDFLMVLFFVQIVKGSNPHMSIHIITPRNKKIFEELASEYSLEVHECNPRSISGIMGYAGLISYFFSKNLIITPATPGKIPFHTKYFAWKLSLLGKSRLVGFADGSSLNKYFYNTIYNFDEKILYTESMITLAKDLGFSVGETSLKLFFKKDDSVLNKNSLEKGTYIVLHPYGSSEKRSLAKNEIIRVIKTIKAKSPNIKIVISGSKKDFAHLQEEVINLAGKVSMSELISLIDSSLLYIGVDTGITHLAGMLGKKSFVIGHEASVFYWFPYYNQNARILYSIKDCHHGIYEGLSHLKECYDEDNRYFQKVPIETIENSLPTFL